MPHLWKFRDAALLLCIKRYLIAYVRRAAKAQTSLYIRTVSPEKHARRTGRERGGAERKRERERGQSYLMDSLLGSIHPLGQGFVF